MNAKYLLVVAVLAAPMAARAADEFDTKLQAAAKDVLKFVQNKKCENVGVLKFLVDKGDGKLVDNAGDLNRGVADRLEVAMILEWPNEDIGIIYQASDAAKKIAGANHLTAAGRKAFFGQDYPLAWGPEDDKVKPSLFLTGNVVISKDLANTVVTIQAFGATGVLEPVTSFEIKTPLRVLAETGRNFVFTPKVHPKLFARGLIDKEEIKKAVVEQSIAMDSGNGPPKPPAPKISLDKDAPVRVSVLVNGEAVAVENGTIREPKVNDKVEVLLENMTDDVHAVVLKVNGENTIFREKFDAKDCYKWILKKRQRVYVTGFQETNDKWNEFRVLTYEESKANEVNYGPNMGMIQVTAFRGQLVDPKVKPPKTEPVIKKDDLVVAAISRGAITFNEDGNLAKPRPNSLNSLKGNLENRERNPTGSKGLIGMGNQTEHNVEKVVFEADPIEAVMNYSIRYRPNK